jgi:hypothetical protein
MSTVRKLRDRVAPTRIHELTRDLRGVAVVRALRHVSPRRRREAEQEVATWPTNVATAILALDGRSAVLHRGAAEQLAGAPRDHFAVRAGLRLAVADAQHDDVAFVAAKALIKTGCVSAVWPLAATWDEGELEHCARRVAARLDPSAVDDLLMRKAVTWDEESAIDEILRFMAPRAPERLAERCAARRGRVRLRAVSALGFCENVEHADALIRGVAVGGSGRVGGGATSRGRNPVATNCPFKQVRPAGGSGPDAAHSNLEEVVRGDFCVAYRSIAISMNAT